MTILKILQYPDLRLRRKGYRVGNIQAVKIQKTIKDMVNTLRHTENCGGLASTQLDLKEPPNIIVIDHIKNPIHDDILCLINPQIIYAENYTIEKEGCMSVASQNDVYGKVKRANKVKVKALDAHGNNIEFTAENYFARCLQHECDHLQGTLYIDYLNKTDQALIEQKLSELARSN